MDNSGVFTSPAGEENQHAYHTAIEQKIQAVITPFQKFIHHQVTSSLLLFICTVAALVWASMPSISALYDAFIEIPIGFHVSHFLFEQSLHFWVNDVLLTFFFFFVGLEIKREFLVGELTDRKRAVLVIFAAVGGMLAPAILFYLINHGTPTASAWGIPMATDTAFALGILSFFKKRIPQGVFTFLGALAIIDDIGAILVIAIFYTPHLNTFILMLAFFFCCALLLINFLGFRKPLPYILLGILVWAALEATDIHGTVAGIIVAFLIPARPRKGPNHFIKRTKELLASFEKRRNVNPLILEDQKQHNVLEAVQEVAQQATTPLQRWESKLHFPIAMIVLPLFALVNAGIPINVALLDDIFRQPLSCGILVGLVIGKPLGVMFFSRIALWSRLGTLPENTNLYHIFSIALLTGIGFTMSIFISNLSFGRDHHLLILAKAAILLSSLLAGIFGAIMLMIVAYQFKTSEGVNTYRMS